MVTRPNRCEPCKTHQQGENSMNIEKDELVDILQEQFDLIEPLIGKMKDISKAVFLSDDVSEESYEIDSVIDDLTEVFESL